MKKLFKYVAASACAVTLTIGATAFAACGGNADTNKFTVDFETNGGSEIASQQVEKGAHATRPADPTKTDFIFSGWYKETGLTNIFNFDEEVINSDTTIYASWEQGTAATATFYWNYEGAPSDGVYTAVTFADGKRIAEPAMPVRSGFEFGGWYTDTNYTTAYSSLLKYNGNQTFYAKWLNSNVFEAEHTQLTGLTTEDEVTTPTGNKMGCNFSGNVSGKDLIRQSAGASGGAFVWGCLNLEGGYLDFEFTSDKAEKGAKLSIVVSAEFWGFKLNPDIFKVLVNPASNNDASVKYSEIDLTFVETGTESNMNPVWVTANIGNIDIKEGKNLIRLYVNNNEGRGQGTITAKGPIVDCIKISSMSELEMIKYNG